jgi:hypothetical protein
MSGIRAVEKKGFMIFRPGSGCAVRAGNQGAGRSVPRNCSDFRYTFFRTARSARGIPLPPVPRYA